MSGCEEKGAARYTLTMVNDETGGRIVYRCGESQLRTLEQLISQTRGGQLSGYLHGLQVMLKEGVHDDPGHISQIEGEEL